jgi:DNA-binding MarR family transcriptional regulator
LANEPPMAKIATGATAVRRRPITARSVDTKRVMRISSGVDPERFEGLDPDATLAWRHYNLGRLLLFVFHAFEARMLDSHHDAGFEDVRQVHLNVMRHIDVPKGTRIIDLAARAGVTKGAMGQLVEECVRLGLVELSRDPADGRAKIVSYSKRGREFMAVTRRAAKRIEADFAELLGPKRYESMRGDLIALREKITARALTR